MSLRICLLSAEYPPETAAGGIGTYTYDLAHALTALRHNVTVVSSAGAGMESARDDHGVRVVRVAAPAPRRRVRMRRRVDVSGRLAAYSERAVAAVDQLAEQTGGFDVVEAPLWNGEASSWSRRRRPPLVTRLVTPVFKTTQILGAPPLLGVEKLERAQCLASTRYAAISHAIGKLVVQHYDLPADRLVHAPLGIALRGRAQRRESEPPHLLYVGRLERRKGIDDLVRALPEILRRCSDAIVDVVGQDTGQAPEPGTYADWSRRLLTPATAERVRFHGYLDSGSLDRLYAGAAAFVAPSLYESFGLVYLEAMARGIPVIGTDVGGVPEIVDNSVGRLIPARDVQALADACVELLQDSALRGRLGAAGEERARSSFSDRAMAMSSVALYEEVAG